VLEFNGGFPRRVPLPVKLSAGTETGAGLGSPAYQLIGNATNPTKVACGWIHILVSQVFNGTIGLDYSLAR
jgi:hypothetical protein